MSNEGVFYLVFTFWLVAGVAELAYRNGFRNGKRTAEKGEKG